MDIAFTPQLSRHLRLSVPSLQPAALLNFTAALSSVDLAQLNRDGAKLQVWSDISLSSAWVHGAEWRAYDFQLGVHTSLASGASLATDVSLRTHDPNPAENELQQDCSLSLQFSVPLTGREYLFSFTYRIVYPTGEIKWLGQYGQNGTISLEHSQTDPKLALGQGWSETDGGYIWTSNGKFVGDLEVAKLASPSDYFVWSIGKESFFDAPVASLAFLVPRVPSHSVLLDTIYLLSASPSIAIAISPLGTITASGAGSLLLQTVTGGSGMHPIDRMITHCSSDVCEAAVLDTDDGHVLLTSTKGKPLKAIILPLKPRPLIQAGHARIKLDRLASFLPDKTTQFSIFSPRNLHIQFFSMQARGSDEDISFALDPPGGPFVLSPVFNLKNQEWQVSILSDYSSIRPLSRPFDVGNLPTPPPSPRLQRDPHPLPPDTLAGVALQTSSEDGTGTPKQHSMPEVLAILLTYVRLIISVATFLLTPVYQLLHGRVDDASGKSPASGRINEQEDPPVQAEEGTQALPSTPPFASSEDRTQKGSDLQLDSPSLDSLLVETHGENVMVAIRPPSAAMSTTRSVKAELNGRKADPKVTTLDQGTFLWEFDGETGGLVKISIT